jgi:hypothetical protein
MCLKEFSDRIISGCLIIYVIISIIVLSIGSKCLYYKDESFTDSYCGSETEAICMVIIPSIFLCYAVFKCCLTKINK